MRYPNIFTVGGLVHATKIEVKIDDHWVPLRPEGFRSIWHRFQAAWLVFRGEADAVIWPRGQ